jgi:hypothetical protein
MLEQLAKIVGTLYPSLTTTIDQEALRVQLGPNTMYGRWVNMGTHNEFLYSINDNSFCSYDIAQGIDTQMKLML